MISRPISYVQILALAGAVSIGFLSAAAESAKLTSSVFDWNTRVEKPTGVGIYRGVTDLPTPTLERFECHITTLHAGNESHPPHQHPQEEFIILQEGELDVYINGETHRIGAGGLFFFSSYDFHSVNNVGDGPATYLVFNYATEKTSQVPHQPAAEYAAKEMLGSNVFPWPSSDAPHEFFNAPTVTVENLTGAIARLASGETLDAEREPAATVIAVKEGELEVNINGESSTVGRGSIIFVASNDEHRLSNPGSSDTVYYTFQITSAKTPQL